MPSSTSVLVLHSSCHEKYATTTPEMTFERAWRQLVATAKLSCDMILIPDMAVAQHHHQQQQNELDTHGSVVTFRNELLDPCGTYNVFSLSNLVADSYILSLTDCRLRPIIASMPSSSDILLPALPVPSTFHFTWNASEAFQADAHTNAYAEIRVDLDVTKAKRRFRKVWQNEESAKTSTVPTTTAATTTTTPTNVTVAEEQKEEEVEEKGVGDQHEQQHSTSTETKQVPPAVLVDNASHSHVPVVNLPCCPAWEIPPLPPARSRSIAHDPHVMHLEMLLESEMNDINRILSFLTVTGLVLFVSFLWTAFHVSHTKSQSQSRASRTPQKTPTSRVSKHKQHRDSLPRTVPMESISMQAVSGGADCNLSPLSLDAILAAQGHEPTPSSPSVALRQVKTAPAESSTSTITYGPKQRSSRRTSAVPIKDSTQDNTNEAEPTLSPCSKLAQEWSRNKSARRSLRRDASNRVEASSAAAVAIAATAATTETKFPLTPVQEKPVRGGSGIAAAPAVAEIHNKSNDAYALEIAGHALQASASVPASPVRVANALPSITTFTSTENTSRNAAASISIPEEHDHPQQQLPPATVSPGPFETARLRPAPSTVNQNQDSSFVNEYWGARAM
jgi:hypothetical protein